MRNVLEAPKQICERWTRLPMKPSQPCSIEKYLGVINFEKYEKSGTGVMIPRGHLYGTQRLGEYSHDKQIAVEAKMRRCGIECLKENPIVVCALPMPGNQIMLTIIDGHHRARYSGKYGIQLVPSLVFTPQALAEIYRLEGIEPTDVDALINKLQADIAETIDSFQQMPDEKQPKAMQGVSAPDDLLRYFSSF